MKFIYVPSHLLEGSRCAFCKKRVETDDVVCHRCSEKLKLFRGNPRRFFRASRIHD